MSERTLQSCFTTFFQQIEDKSAVFFDLVRLTESQDAQLRKRAAELLAVAFVYSENKQEAWEELVRLASVEDREVRKGAVLALSSGYTEVPDKEKAWKDLFKLSVTVIVLCRGLQRGRLDLPFSMCRIKHRPGETCRCLLITLTSMSEGMLSVPLEELLSGGH